MPASLLYSGVVSHTEERFEDIAVREDSPAVVEGGLRHYRMEKKSRGWFAVLSPFGIALHIGAKPPKGIEKGSHVTIMIEAKK